MNYAIILASGKGKRLKSDTNKMLIEIGGKPLIYYSIMAFNDHPDISEIIVTTNKENKASINKIIKEYRFKKVKTVILGGETRQESLKKAFSKITAQPEDLILVHNGANPLPSQQEISKSIETGNQHGTCIVGHKPTSTIKETKKGAVTKTHDRNKLFAAQTPQTAQYQLLQKALKSADPKATDEAMLLEAIGQKVRCIPAHEDNFKVTTQSDLKRLRAILEDSPDNYRTGFGQDSHMFSEKKMGLTIAGLTFKDQPKLDADSDGDVILHAIFNAISQAIGDMSLGFYADSMCQQGIKNSQKYLKVILTKMKKQGFALNSLGLMLECQKPKIDPLTAQLKKSLSKILDLPTKKIGITATTGEQSPYGQGLGIQCFAIVSLFKKATSRHASKTTKPAKSTKS